MGVMELSRADVETPISFRSLLAPEQKLKLRTVDVGVGGLRVYSPEPFPVGACFRVEFLLPNSPLPLRGEAQVRWCRAEGNGHLLGVAFVDRAERRTGTIAAYIARSRREAEAAARRPARGWRLRPGWVLSLFK